MKRLALMVAMAWSLACGAALADPAMDSAPSAVVKVPAFAEFGPPLYGPDMVHWPFVNPDAPKGGAITLGAFGTYDSLNTLILRGSWPAGLGMITDSLMTGSADELTAVYGLLAESAEYPQDKSWIIFTLRAEARWHDGVPVTAEDVAYTFAMIRQHGRPFLQSFYEDVAGVEILDPRRVKFSFKTRDTMKPLVAVAKLEPIAKHYWEKRDISQTTLEPPLGNGAYRIKEVDAGRSITYERVADYWAKDLPVNRGLYNLDTLRYDYYRDDTVMFEAFLAGKIDYRAENRAQRWATGYDTTDARDGRIVRATLPDHSPRGAYGFVFNLRRPLFQDIRVRKALTLMYDFEAVQRTLLYGQYRRIASWFPNSEYGVSGPPTAEEKAILDKYRDHIAPEVLNQEFIPPRTDGSGNNRTNQREALKLLREAGWEMKDNLLVNAQGQPFKFEIMLSNPVLVRVSEPFVQALRKIGIEANLRVVDTSQYQVRADDYDFDLVVIALNFFAPPGTELRAYFNSTYADVRGQGNFAAIKDPVVDSLVEELVKGHDLPTIEATTRALDRVLLWGHYMVPFWYNDTHWLAYWNKLSYPVRTAKYGTGFPAAWWYDPTKAATLKR
ncbi:microcin C transport system substrate-binding protein [uncultured Gammaproteobacteria bacterium]